MDTPNVTITTPHAERLLLVLGCDYRGGVAGCGCDKSRVCLMGKGWPIPGTDARQVYAGDCLACVRGEERGAG